MTMTMWPPVRPVPAQTGRTALIVLVIVTAVLGVVGCIVLAAASRSPVGFGLTLIYALIPLPFLVLAYWWLDRVEPEPWRYKLAAFVWGGVVAVAIAIAIQILTGLLFELDEAALASWVAPLSEEPAKGLFLLLTFLRQRHVIDGVVDGLVLAGIVGLGFAFVENIGYYASSYLGSVDQAVAGAEGATITFVVRGLFSPLAHPLFTSAFGIALGVAVARRSWLAKIALAAAGMTGSILMHALWNASLSYGGPLVFLAVYLALGLLLVVLIVIAIIARYQHLRTLRASLEHTAARGWIPHAELPFLVSFSQRRRARNYAAQVGGPGARSAMARYQRLATEMGFLHHSVMAGRRKPRGVERTYRLLDTMADLRRRTWFPPVYRPAPAPYPWR